PCRRDLPGLLDRAVGTRFAAGIPRHLLGDDPRVVRRSRQREGEPVTVQAVEPVVKEIEVGIPPHEAFELFTERMASWWLSSHSIGAEPFPSSEGRREG